MFLVSSETQELSGVHPVFEFFPTTALPYFTLDAPSSVIYNLYATDNISHIRQNLKSFWATQLSHVVNLVN
jgi:hypothetical protein